MLLPLFLNLSGRRVLLVGGGPVAAAKLQQLLAAAADVHVVSPEVVEEIDRTAASCGVVIHRRPFVDEDLDQAWLVVAAATPAVNREVAAAAEARRIFVNAVDDPANASAFLSGVIRREGVTIAVSTNGDAPGLTALIRQGFDELLPRRDLAQWVREARRQRRQWKAEGVPMEQRRPLLLDALNRIYAVDRRVRLQADGRDVRLKPDATNSPANDSANLGGRVSLVGAGPGDPALLTRKAIAMLRAADLVLYDALIDERILRYGRHAQRFFVGKRQGRHALSQDKINALMVRAARRGRRVVRLKGGDPFVLGRGGEEAIALASAGVSFDVVPGVTSAIAAPALAGIPVTHRGLASAFYVVSGHDDEAFAAAIQRVEPGGITLVVLMGVARIAALAGRLIARGWARETPAALVVDASMPRQQAWRGTLDDLAGGRYRDVIGSPAGPGTIVVGEVVSVAETLCQPSISSPHTAARG
jgi:uroporphyrin-III C-methyltransferase / precorrin-2 dehydrogenase / sirohydrochlorin ferrochelatase